MPKSIYERETSPTLSPPEQRERLYRVKGNDSPMTIANKLYQLEEYDPDAWRLICEANGITNPFTFKQDFLGKLIRIPPRPLPDFTD